MKKLLLAATLLTTPAQADIINTVGLVQIIAPSVTVQSNFLADNGLPAQVIWAEQQGVLLLAPLATDTGTIAAGTVVNSYFMALNTDGDAYGLANTSVTFDGAVLGLVYLLDAAYNASPNYAASDFLGAPSTTYNESFCSPFTASIGGCGFETFQLQGYGGVFDSASFAGNTAAFFNQYGIPGDFARIITAPVPGPIVGGGLSSLALLLLFLARRRAKSEEANGIA